MDATRDDATRARVAYRSEIAGERVESFAASRWSRVATYMDDRRRISSATAPRAASDGDGGARRRLECAWRAALARGVELGLEGERRQWNP